MSNIAQKIAKLIEKADSTTHPEEAETFMAKAHELMTKHGLDLMDLGRLSEDPVGADKEALSHSASYAWMPKLASAACRYYGVDWVRFKRGKNVVYTVAGRESARITFMLMMPYLEREVKRVARKAFNEGYYNSRMTAATRCGNALAARIFEMAEEHTVTQHRGEGVNALVPVDLTKQVLDDLYPKARKGRRVSLKTDYVAEEAVKDINLNRQTENHANTKQIAG